MIHTIDIEFLVLSIFMALYVLLVMQLLEGDGEVP